MRFPLSTFGTTCAVIATVLTVTSAQTQAEDITALLARISAPPGLPKPNATLPFWLLSPPHPRLTTIQSKVLPTQADIVVIGSGISGCSITKTLLEELYAGGQATGKKRKIVVLEARNITSGATGRNGGHIKASPYDIYLSNKPIYGKEEAKKTVQFQTSHLDALISVVKAEGWNSPENGAEAREVETVDLFFYPPAWERAVAAVADLRTDWPELASGINVWEKEAAVKKFQCSSTINGAITYRSGAAWPYRLVTSCFATLLAKYPDSLSIETNTPAVAIASSSNPLYPFVITTPRGTIRATHVVHATNAWAAQLVPGLVSKVLPIRNHMSAQQAGLSFPSLSGSRSWSFINRHGFEYVTQRPGMPSSSQMGGEIMAGTGFQQSNGRGLDEIGIINDDTTEHLMSSHLNGVLPVSFGDDGWGAERQGKRVKNLWTGILGFTPDIAHIVGRLDVNTTGRAVQTGPYSQGCLKNPGEWISAAFHGEGMVNAWLSGVALGLMVLGKEDIVAKPAPGRLPGKVSNWLPSHTLLSLERLANMNISSISF